LRREIDITCCCCDYYPTRSWCEACNACEGLQNNTLKITYSAHRIKYLFFEGREVGEGKILSLNRTKTESNSQLYEKKSK